MIDLQQLSAPMKGEDCRAELVSEQWRSALKQACAEDMDVWSIYPMSFAPECFDLSLQAFLDRPDWRTFILFDGEEFAGMSSFINIDPARQTLEIGGTYYRPAFRGTGFNRRVKNMMLERAFASGIRRVEFRVDKPTSAPKPAMRKLGAVREGVLRADRITWNGHVRDTVLFAILKDEWPV